MAGQAINGFKAMGFNTEDSWLLDTCGLIPADLRGWSKEDAITLARAINHQGVDPLMAEYLFDQYKGNVSGAFEDMARDGFE